MHPCGEERLLGTCKLAYANKSGSGSGAKWLHGSFAHEASTGVGISDYGS